MLSLVILFILGLSTGSFLNVVIYRLKIKKSILKPRSFCPACNHTLVWYDLIPVLSFVFLGGKCRYCRKRISWQHPLVELSAGLLFILFYLKSGSLDWRLLFNLLFVSILIVVFVYDLKHYLILDKVIVLGAVLAVIASICLGKPEFPYALLGSAVVGGFFALLVLISRGKWMGGGDVKFGFLIGLIVGWPSVLVSLFLAFVLGGIIGVLLIVFRKKTLKSAVPFGTFLATATVTVMLYGEKILDWYLNILA